MAMSLLIGAAYQSTSFQRIKMLGLGACKSLKTDDNEKLGQRWLEPDGYGPWHTYMGATGGGVRPPGSNRRRTG